jgi:hypothetical protein
MLIDNFGIISQAEWHVKTRQNQDIFEAKMLKYQRISE